MVMNPDKLRRYTVGVLVSNEPGVLSRVSGLFSRRSFNIESLAVGPTHLTHAHQTSSHTTAHALLKRNLARHIEFFSHLSYAFHHRRRTTSHDRSKGISIN